MEAKGTVRETEGRRRLRIVLVMAAAASAIAAGLRFLDGESGMALLSAGVGAVFVLAILLTYRE